MAQYLLNELVKVEYNTLIMDGIEVFECNKDCLEMLKVMYDFTQQRKPFSLNDIMECLEIEQTEDNVFAIQNTINYLRGCFIINEC